MAVLWNTQGMHTVLHTIRDIQRMFSG